MLKNIDPLLTGDLLKILADMGHGDELAIVDANFPAFEMGKRVVELPGTGAPSILKAILGLFPLDEFVDQPAGVMDAAGQHVPIYDEFLAAVKAAEGKDYELEVIERFAFYERTRTTFAVVLTGERRLYGNIIIKKGVIRPD